MSSLTTISSGMESPLEVEELVDIRLSCHRRRETTTAPLLSPEGHSSGCAGGEKGENSIGGSTTPARQHGKRARTMQGSSDDNDDDAGVNGGTKKKLRLTGEQAALLEKSFSAHNFLSHGEKHDLASQLGLKPRQVEVWFQNRRARTKLKQMELDCELLLQCWSVSG